uniref:Uncharacterized protein n=1 Tax=Oryza sativa subsp. japonica TaxID=39947 RepID=Q2QT68_ORYSJ|nr:hypothetical protein LOC_Os12g21670 [Oryza sativa Japonica Group]
MANQTNPIDLPAREPREHDQIGWFTGTKDHAQEQNLATSFFSPCSGNNEQQQDVSATLGSVGKTLDTNTQTKTNPPPVNRDRPIKSFFYIKPDAGIIDFLSSIWLTQTCKELSAKDIFALATSTTTPTIEIEPNVPLR